ncbi:aa_trans domain-containing protein [Caerostris extrusa]|uniref:Aa_trans domain-containing protein n=1 Tax=Caerostris extrusa TaxID=172846 RepID=A0AAV4N411_CAEEX|nr:aa_trans domain-containing protein [Caerostris extrusa]
MDSNVQAIYSTTERKSYNSIKSNTETQKGDNHEGEEPAPRGKGLSLWLASIFIVAEMAGSGVLALPRAVADAGWSGIAMIVFCGGLSLYSGVCLGRCWSIVEERYEGYKEKNRYPYPTIAEKAYGTKMRYFVSFCIDSTLLGVAIVFLLLSSQLIGSLAASWGISFCYWILILAAILWPLTFLGTPEEILVKPAAVIALATTVTACVILIVLIAEEIADAETVSHPAPSVKSFFLSYGTILFAFGGAASFPTFQNDMKDRTQFPKAATFDFWHSLVLYLPVAVLGYLVYGNTLVPNVLDALPYSIPKSVISIMLALHMFFAFLLVINAPVQDLEEFFKVSVWKRIAIRSLIMLGVVFIAQSIPRFGQILNLIGGSLTTLTCIIFPCWFYFKLCGQQDPTWPIRNISLYERYS